MYIKTSFNLGKLKNKEWYHQRFDGCPMFLFLVGEAEVKKEKRKPAGTEADIRVCFFNSGRADWYLDMKDVSRGARAIIKKAKIDPNISKKLLSKWKRDEDKFEDFFYKAFPKASLKKMTDSQLSNLWNKFWKLCINRQSSSSIIDHFALGTDVLIRDMLKKELKDKITRESDFTKFFSIATAPVYQSFINQAEIDLLKIITGKSREKLPHYQKRYYWIKNNYFLAQELSVEDFEKEIDAWRKSGKNLKEEFKRIENTPKLAKKAKDKFFQENKISLLLKTLLVISEDFSWWQDERKKSTLFTIDMGMKILKEVADRKGYALNEMRYALPGEIPLALKGNKPSHLELQKRSRECVVLGMRDGNYIAIGEKVAMIKKIISGQKDLSEIRDFRGLTASVGIAQGRVKILKSSTEIGKVEKGDILVAVMTRPDYVVAMKKAAAIVTDEGGITSHAAIVSRELGIPCVIGTKIATEVLHDGDLVEVNANHGIVKIIK